MINRMQRYFDKPQTSQNALAFESPLFNGPMMFSPFTGLDTFFEQMFKPMKRTLQDKVEQTKEGLRLSIEVPGYSSEDIAIAVDQGILTIEATRENNSFKRSYSLTDKAVIKGIAAELKDGILSINIPLKQSEVIRIPIN